MKKPPVGLGGEAMIKVTGGALSLSVRLWLSWEVSYRRTSAADRMKKEENRCFLKSF